MTATLTTARVRVLGGLTVEDVGERELGSRKGRLLLKVLAVGRGSPVSSDRLAEILWGDRQPARPGEQVGVLVSRLRAVLGTDRLPRTDAGYALLADWFDLDELAARVAEAADALGSGRLGAARAAAEAALALARGSVLPEEDGEWVEVERADAEVLRSSARRIAAEAAGRAGDHAAAGALAERALVDDPYDEIVLRVLMRAHAAAGRPASALAAYRRVRDLLVEELGISPTSETEALHDAIVMDEPPARAIGGGGVPSSDALPGRDAELRVLDAALDRVASSMRAESLVVEGEAAIGKTALIDTWAARVAPSALVLVGRCDQLGRDLPLQPIIDAVAEHLAGLGAEERVRSLGADAAVVGPLLGVGDGDDAGGATVVADAEIGRARLFAGLVAVVSRLAGARPTAFVVDDLHLAGPSTLAWLAFAARRLPRLVVVATTRPTADALLPNATTIVLGPLDLVATAIVVGSDRAAELHERSGGHPLLLRALADADADGDDGTLPTTVADAVDRRLRGLGPADATARVAAILGEEVDLDLLADVMRAPAVELLDHLEAVAATGFLVERGTGFAFRHDLEREALAASAGSARRALVHREAARAMAARPLPDPLAIAIHARLGGETSLAVQWYVKAAEIAVARFDLEAAEAHLDAGLALEKSADAYAARARVRMATFHLDEAAEDAAAAIACGGGSRALEVAGWVAYYRRDYDSARACADEGVERATDAAVRVSCLALGGRVRHGAGDLPAAAARLEEASDVDAPPEVRWLAGVWLAQVRLHQGRPDDALAILQRALVDPDRIAHPFAALHGRLARVMALGYLGRVHEGLAASREFEAAIVRAGTTGSRFFGMAANSRAWLLRWSGSVEEADELNTEALARTDATGPRAEAHYAGLLDLADGRLLVDDAAGAGALLERLAPIADWEGTMAWHQRHRWRLVRARVALAEGDRDGAAALAAEVALDAAARGARRYELFAIGLGALAGGEPASDLARLDAVVADLGRCAAVDGWSLVNDLGRAFDVAAWRHEAAQLAATVVRGSPDERAARALVGRRLG
ncbi:MAG: hypothetical protein QOI47_2292 [Actinomycetota bacterium]|nr:hypothetical protein [Actinomycetota bacterium]